MLISKKIYSAERKPFMKNIISTIATVILLFHLFFKCLQDFTRLYPLLVTISIGLRK